MAEGAGDLGEAAGSPKAAGMFLGGVGAVCALHAHAIARLTSIKRGNSKDVVRPTIFMRVPSLVQAPGTDCMQGVRTLANHCSWLKEIGIQDGNKVNSRNRELLKQLVVRDEELNSRFGSTGKMDCVGDFDA